MKILVVNNNGITKAKDGKYYIHNSYAPFLEELALLNDEVCFFQLGVNTEKDNGMSNYCINDRKFNIRAINANRYIFVSYLKAYVCGICLLTKYDALYMFYPNNFKFLGFVAKLLGKKLGLYIRGQVGLTSSVSRKLFRMADISLTVAGIDRIVAGYGGKADTIRPMIALSENDIVKEREYILKSEYRILFLGRIEYDKGLRELLNAMKELIDNGIENFHLDMVGDGNHLNELKILSSNLGLDSKVTFWGNQSGKDRIKQLFIQSDIYILPSYHEGFPRTLFEAMILGTPIITTFVGGVPYLMKDGENCVEIKTRSVKSIYEILSNVLNHYEQMILIAQNGTKTMTDYLNGHSLSHAEQLTKYLNIK